MQLKSPAYLVCATKPEWVPLKKIIPITKINLDDPLTLPSPSRGEGGGEGDHGFKLIQIGVGTKNLPQLFSHFRSVEPRPSLVCSFGLSGGLIDTLKEGDLVLPNQFVSNEGKPVIFPSPSMGEGDLVGRARFILQELGHDFTEGILFTSPRVLATEEEKREAGKKYGAIAVDMETYPLAQFCQAEKIPFLSIRSIFDPLSWDLRNLSDSKMIDADGNFKLSETIGSILKNPKLIYRLPRYQKSLSLGSKKLAQFLFNFFAVFKPLN